MPRPQSIRNRVLAGSLAALLALVAALALIAWSYAKRAADEAYDRVLAAAVISIADGLQVEEGFATVDVPQAAFAMLGASRMTRVFWRVASPNGAFLTGHYDLAQEEPRPSGGGVRISDASYRGAPIRLASASRYFVAGDVADWAVIRVAETREARDALAAELSRNILTPVLLAALAAVAMLWFGVTRAVAPLAEVGADMARRSPLDLAPIPAGHPREVAPLVDALNGFMARLAASLGATRAMTADAAHQLRTPIAALRAQAELALGERDPRATRRRIERVLANAQALGQIQEQLLNAATIAHRLEAQPRLPVSLRAVIEEALEQLDEEALARIDLVLPARDAWVEGDQIALREMVQNILGNALTYAPAGPVRAQVAAMAGAVAEIVIADRGPGVPDNEKAAVFQRFRRGEAGRIAPGTGLGLSIARDVAQACGGEIGLEDTEGGGLTVRVRLPAMSAPAQPVAASATLLAAVVILGSLLAAAPLAAQTRSFPAAGPSTATLQILSDGEHETLRTLIEAFQARRAGVAVEYRALSSGLLRQAVITSPFSEIPPDLVISGALDQQVRLVNDGHARRLSAPAIRQAPAWSRWRDELVGFTREAMVIAYDPHAIPPTETPRTRLRLAQMLETDRKAMKGRVIIYDIAFSGIGYVFAAFDAAASPVSWRLARALGDAEARLAESSGDMLIALERGEAALAFGIEGSASVRARIAASNLAIAPLEDYGVAVSRTALVPKGARNPLLAEEFVAFLVSPEAQSLLGEASTSEEQARQADRVAPTATIPLGPASLVYGDERKRSRFLDTWIQLILKP